MRSCCSRAVSVLKRSMILFASLFWLLCAAIASTRLLVRPSWRKKTRCPTPQSGADRNSSGPAPPCVMPSARPLPMWWTRRSEKRFTVWLESAALGLVEEPLAIILPVVNEGVWQWAQPTFVKVARLLTLDGVSGAGMGGAKMRMKLVTASMSEMTAGLEVAAPVGAVVKLSGSFGVAMKRHAGVSSRSCGNSWFEIPISTLYASLDNMSRDLFCAFHPKRVMVPSFALRFAFPLRCALG